MTERVTMDKVTTPYLVASTPSTKNIKFLLNVDIVHSVQWLQTFLVADYREKREPLFVCIPKHLGLTPLEIRLF